MTIWQRIKHWFARPDPYDVDSKFPNSTMPVTPEDAYVPSESTWRQHKDAYRPSAWDRLGKK